MDNIRVRAAVRASSRINRITPLMARGPSTTPPESARPRGSMRRPAASWGASAW